MDREEGWVGVVEVYDHDGYGVDGGEGGECRIVAGKVGESAAGNGGDNLVVGLWRLVARG